jgi:gluconate 2-dehydrogenase subunit 3-like protein
MVVGAAGIAAKFPALECKAASASSPSATDASLAAGYSPRFFSAPEIRSLAALAETVIPTDDHSPGAVAAGVHEFMDDLVADSDLKTQALWREGLAAVEKDSVEEFRGSFADLSADQRAALLGKFAAKESNPATLEERFFVVLKRMTIEGYYTSAVGIHQDLNYQGNTAMADFPGCEHPNHK